MRNRAGRRKSTILESQISQLSPCSLEEEEATVAGAGLPFAPQV